MKFSEAWLRQWVNPTIDTAALSEQLTMAGLEVDSVTTLADDFTGIVVGQIVECGKHPNADKLNVCQVDTGAKQPFPIVCGGSNVRVGLKVALATVGAVLPGDFKIKKSKLRGEPSHGMICSSKELGIDDPDALPKGIMELPDDAPIGVDVRDYLNLDDPIIDIELTPNRGDCASIRGIACEVGVLNNVPVTAPDSDEVAATCDDSQAVAVKDTTVCPRYVGRVLKGISTTATTPRWMRVRLEQSGVRVIHPVVDVCNYVMLELGQPMHGFDIARLDGGITVRRATKNEKLTLLDEQQVTLRTADLIIADDKKALAIAGVMGGLDSGVTEKTTDVFLESAYFDPVAVSLTARHFGLVTDSSYRFERGVDYQLQRTALERATVLLHDIVGGDIGPVIEVVDERALPVTPDIQLRRERIVSILGIELKDAEVIRILDALGMTVDTDGLGWQVTVPSNRSDITLEVDLIEELARLYGYNNIPTTDFHAPLKLTKSSVSGRLSSRVADFLVDRGYREAVTYSFVDAEKQQLLAPHLACVEVQNPISSDMSVMRTTIWSGLLQTMHYNQNRQITRQRLFETGLCFWHDGKTICQEDMLGLLICGDQYPMQWGETSRPVDFFDMKGDIDGLLATLGRRGALRYEPGSLSALHPGQSTDLYCGDELVGYLGVLHPSLVKAFELRQAPVLLQLKFSMLKGEILPQYKAVSKFPAVKRDLALVIDEDVSVSKILQSIEQKSDSLVSDVRVFDLYRGEGIEKGKKSVALGLTFQDPSRTLVDADINSVIQNIINVLKEELQATLRT